MRTIPLLHGLLALLLACAGTASATPRITVLYDAFGDDPAMHKDWGFAALIEVDGRRILFDTGNDAGIFARNVAAKGVDLRDLDLVVMSHRHADHMAGLGVVLAANPTVPVYAPQEGFGIYGSSLPADFYRKAPELPARMRYYDGEPPETLRFGSAWQGADFRPLTGITEIAPGVWAIVGVSDAPGTRELREVSLAIRTEQGLVLVVGCSHPGIGSIVAEARRIDPDIHLVVGGFHFVTADDAAIAGMVDALRAAEVSFIAPGHCTGEPTFAALLAAFGERYLYAGVGAVLELDRVDGPERPRGAAARLSGAEQAQYRLLAVHGHDHDHVDGVLAAAHDH
ncbi:MBL fold metallo-hydrolase [Coralloluteibacterium thermophilus]|uniref:MBL fold metallo-hydrolase n=1 Tax=Coralloluteibacterium thermophilum TaxID=2707049 RepID=A0ABV9NNB3_9GAMM